MTTCILYILPIFIALHHLYQISGYSSAFVFGASMIVFSALFAAIVISGACYWLYRQRKNQQVNPVPPNSARPAEDSIMYADPSARSFLKRRDSRESRMSKDSRISKDSKMSKDSKFSKPVLFVGDSMKSMPPNRSGTPRRPPTVPSTSQKSIAARPATAQTTSQRSIAARLPTVPSTSQRSIVTRPPSSQTISQRSIGGRSQTVQTIEFV